jgi:predicted alpha/beta hydrolase family esterase
MENRLNQNAIIIHGSPGSHEYYEMDFPSPSNAHWIPWLQQKFLRSKILCQTPEMPFPYAARYQEWVDTIKSFQIHSKTTLVGHSSGGGFLLKWLTDNPHITAEKLVLVAPWLDPEREFEDFLLCTPDPSLVRRIGEMHIFYSSDDSSDIQKTRDIIVKTYPEITQHNYSDKGHFCFNDLGGSEFLDLWKVIKG